MQGDIEITPFSCQNTGCYRGHIINVGKHISTVVQRCDYTLIGLARMRRRLPRDVKKLLVEALVFPLHTILSGCVERMYVRLPN